MPPRPENHSPAPSQGNVHAQKEEGSGGGEEADGLDLASPGAEKLDLGAAGAGTSATARSGTSAAAGGSRKRSRSTSSSARSSSDSTSPTTCRPPRMEPNNELANMDFQQLLHLANMGRQHLLQQQSGQPSGQLVDQVGNYNMLPHRDMNMMQTTGHVLPQGGQFGGNLAHGTMSDLGGVAASTDPSNCQTPVHSSAADPIDIEETSPPLKNNPARRTAATARKKGKQVMADDEPQRTKKDNFQSEEDRLLVMSWLEISCDPMTNTGQTNEAFWDKITALYNSKRQSFPERSKRSLQSRYDTIKKPVAKFSSYYAEVVRRNPSGMTDADKTSIACTEYARLEPKPFKFMHCWDIMKNNPKFQDTKHGRNYRGEEDDNYQQQQFTPKPPPYVPESVEGQHASGDQSCPTPPYNVSKRPLGRDAAKRARKKHAGGSTSTESDFAQSMHDLVIKYDGNAASRQERNDSYLLWKKQEQEHARQDRKVLIKLERRKVKIEEDKLKIKQKNAEAEHQRAQVLYRQEEERILGIDASKYQEPLRSFYLMKQKEIMDANARVRGGGDQAGTS